MNFSKHTCRQPDVATHRAGTRACLPKMHKLSCGEVNAQLHLDTRLGWVGRLTPGLVRMLSRKVSHSPTCRIVTRAVSLLVRQRLIRPRTLSLHALRPQVERPPQTGTQPTAAVQVALELVSSDVTGTVPANRTQVLPWFATDSALTGEAPEQLF
jgi:hypothetical protein